MRRPASTGRKRTTSESKMDDDDNLNEEMALQSSKKRCRRANDKAIDFEVTENQTGAMQELEKELQKEKPNKKYVKEAMKTTYKARRKWILEECPPVSAIMDKYPVLKKQAYVCKFVYTWLLMHCNCLTDKTRSTISARRVQVWI